MNTVQTSPVTSVTRRTAQRGLTIYFAIVVVLSALIEAAMIGANLNGGANSTVTWLLLTTALMSTPTIASLVARLALREGFADVSFRLGQTGRAAIVLALISPLAVALVSYGGAWATGLAGFALPPTGQWLVTIVIMIIINLVLGSGEEIGWRGYMLTRLIDAGVPKPVLASGLIWGIWHIPLILWAGYADGPQPALSAAFFMTAAVALGSILARMRLETGSIWPPIAFHAAWNVIIQSVFDAATTGAQAAFWVGETGVLTILTLVIFAACLSRKRIYQHTSPVPMASSGRRNTSG